MSTPTGGLTIEQRKHLDHRIDCARNALYRGMYDDPPDSPEVKKAKKVIEGWKVSNAKKQKAREKAVDKSITAAREAVHFRSPADALAAVKKLEQEAGI